MESQPLRAPRYAIAMPVRYRGARQQTWRQGKVKNISRTGVLFTTDRALDVSVQIEMIVQLPAEVSGASAAQVLCAGRIVRTVLPAASDQPPEAAAQILSYKLYPKERMSEI
jgi:hypothetical protein